jgi:uncharacterized membrane protein (UPF0127 family)
MTNKFQRFLKVVFLTFVVLVINVQTGYSEDQDINFAVDQIKIITTDGTRLGFTVEVASTRKQRQQGLMHREFMDQDKGMLFIFPQTGPFRLWMKNTKIPLDMLFIDELGVVNYIHPMAEPLSTITIKSEEPVKAVLEINGGLSEKLGITPGSRIVYPAFSVLPNP